ncbi:hypothetical protein BJF82_14325 [Kytococcus sp. CUA-901]|nr:hypothetical protein BJF82_14325 [Kytococcus sp. CUA-901]
MGLVTPVDAGVAKPLVGSLVHEVVCQEDDLAQLVGRPAGRGHALPGGGAAGGRGRLRPGRPAAGPGGPSIGGTMADLTELVPLPGGEFVLGARPGYPEEGPTREVRVGPFAMERHPVTNAQFAAFVRETAYRTTAERAPDPATLPPGVDPSVLVPGSLVFTPTAGPVPLHRWDLWWRWVPGASWRTRGVPAPTWRASPTTRWCTSASRTRRPTRPGPGGTCRPRPSTGIVVGSPTGRTALGHAAVGGAP